MGHKQLDVWKESMVLVKMVYQISKGFPKSETYGLTSQLRRAAVSIPSNIAEGSARNGNKELYRFLGISLGSASEVETLIIIARDLDYINADFYKFEKQLNSVKKLLIGYKNHIKKELAEKEKKEKE